MVPFKPMCVLIILPEESLLSVAGAELLGAVRSKTDNQLPRTEEKTIN